MRSAVFILLAAGFVVGASPAMAAGGIKCAVPSAPRVTVNARTADIVYDYSKNSAQLKAISREKGSTPNPLHDAPDTYVNGLRSDKPKTNTEVTVSGVTETFNGKPTRVCLWYDKVDLNIDLQPVIYLAKERNVPGKCREEILIHERRHVQVDREVMNQLAQDAGRSIQNAVNNAGAQGPYPAVNTEAVRDKMAKQIHAIVDQHVAQMTKILERRQAQVDTAEEYARISAICRAEDQSKHDNARSRSRPSGQSRGLR